MYITLSNLVSSFLGRPKYLPLYKKVGDEYIHVGYMKEDLSKGVWNNNEYMSPPFYSEMTQCEIEYILRTINVYKDGFSFGE